MRRLPTLKTPFGRLALTLAIGLGLLAVVGCGEYPQSTLHTTSEFAGRLGELFRSIFWWAVGVFVVVEGILLYAMFRFRERGSDDRPEPVHGHTSLEIGWTLAPAIILVVIAVPTIQTIFQIDRPPERADLTVEVVGKQWWWEFRYPELGIVTANEAHIPVGATVYWRLRSTDVIHSFWVPKLGGKRDLIPGRENLLWFSADSTGVFMGQCGEYCGIAHALMGLRVVAQEREAFDAWVERQRRPAREPESELAVRGQELFLSSACIGCHRVEGTHAAGIVGPDLTHIGSRRTLAAGILENTPENMVRWIQNPQEIKPGNLMPDLGLNDQAARAIAAYLETLE